MAVHMRHLGSYSRCTDACSLRSLPSFIVFSLVITRWLHPSPGSSRAGGVLSTVVRLVNGATPSSLWVIIYHSALLPPAFTNASFRPFIIRVSSSTSRFSFGSGNFCFMFNAARSSRRALACRYKSPNVLMLKRQEQDGKFGSFFRSVHYCDIWLRHAH